MTKTVNIYPRSGPARGLIMRVRLEDHLNHGRALIRSVGYLSMSDKIAAGNRLPHRIPTRYKHDPDYQKKCAWCGEPLSGRARSCHPECVKWYMAGTGVTRMAGGGPYLIDPGPCDICGAAFPAHGERMFEVDHRTALSVAREMQLDDDPRWWRAWAVSNLRWLCHECHATKTGADRRRLAKMRALREPPIDVRQQRLF